MSQAGDLHGGVGVLTVKWPGIRSTRKRLEGAWCGRHSKVAGTQTLYLLVTDIKLRGGVLTTASRRTARNGRRGGGHGGRQGRERAQRRYSYSIYISTVTKTRERGKLTTERAAGAFATIVVVGAAAVEESLHPHAPRKLAVTGHTVCTRRLDELAGRKPYRCL